MPAGKLATDRWPEIQKAAELGVPYSTLAAKYGVSEVAIRKRASRHAWLVPTRLLQRIHDVNTQQASHGVTAASQRLLEGQKNPCDSDTVTELVHENWDVCASKIRTVAWTQGLKALQQTPEGPPIKDAGDWSKVIKVMREATGLFQDSSAVQVSIFGGAAAGFDGKTVDIETEIIDDAPDYDEEM